MHIDQHGHPIHTRALQVRLHAGTDPQLSLRGYLLDLRKRGFVPVGSALQGSGIIHHMEIEMAVDCASGEIGSITAPQPTVAFEASAATGGESCRDPVARLTGLIGVGVDDAGAKLRESFGGPLGCSHLVALTQFACATASLYRQRREAQPWSVQRDLVIDANEIDGQSMAIALQLSDLVGIVPEHPTLPAQTLLEHTELRAAVGLSGWPADIASLQAGFRRRRRESIGILEWTDPVALQGLIGLNLGRGGSAAIARLLAEEPIARDAFLMLGPTLIQCRASFPDKWLAQVVETPGHPGLMGQVDSCYMWRRGGGLEKVRQGLTGA